MTKFYKKFSFNITWNKKHSSKQVVPITYTMKEKFLASAT